MDNDLVAKAEIRIEAPVTTVWDALINPTIIEQYMFGTTVISDWEKGSKIIWRGEWKGKFYEDKGEIIDIEPEKLLKMTHYSPLSGGKDVPENYHGLCYELKKEGAATQIVLEQNNNKSKKEKIHSEQNWQRMLESMKKVIEGR